MGLEYGYDCGGGFGNSFSPSWVLRAMSALGESTSAWMPSASTPQDYLAGLQQNDGGIEPSSDPVPMRIWATAYTIPAALGRTWGALLQSFPLPDTSKLEVASSTPEVAVQTITKAPTPAHRTELSVEPPVVVAPRQPAAVASAPAAGFFTHVWDAIAAFFLKLL